MLAFFYFMVAFGPSTYFFKYIINVVSYYLNIKVQSMDVIHGNDNNHNNLARQTIAEIGFRFWNENSCIFNQSLYANMYRFGQVKRKPRFIG